MLCPLVPIRKLGLGQQLNSSLEVDLVVDMVSQLSKVGGDYSVLDKLFWGRGVWGAGGVVQW